MELFDENTINEIIKNVECTVNVSKYVEEIHNYIKKKNNFISTSPINSDKKPELVLASRSSENPINVIDRTSDSIYRIEIRRINSTDINNNLDISIPAINIDNSKTEDQIHIVVKLYDSNDKLQLCHVINYYINNDTDNLFKQLIPGIFINPIY